VTISSFPNPQQVERTPGKQLPYRDKSPSHGPSILSYFRACVSVARETDVGLNGLRARLTGTSFLIYFFFEIFPVIELWLLEAVSVVHRHRPGDFENFSKKSKSHSRGQLTGSRGHNSGNSRIEREYSRFLVSVVHRHRRSVLGKSHSRGRLTDSRGLCFAL